MATTGLRSIWRSTTEPRRPNPATTDRHVAVWELAANKVLALFDRAEARDFLDLVELTRHFELPGLLELAAEKDAGFDAAGLLEALSSVDRFTSADFGITATEYEQIRATVASWRRVLGRGQGREPLDRDLGFDR
jgi:hypothetical protein